MSELLNVGLVVAVLAPLVGSAALVPALLQRAPVSEPRVNAWTQATLLISLVGAVVGAGRAIDLGVWFRLDQLSVHAALRSDLAGAVLSLLSALWCFAGARMAKDYLHREVGFLRFQLMLGVLAAGMQLIALGSDLTLVFVGWELAGLASATLIAWRHVRADAAKAGARAFLTNRVGDAAFLLALALVAGMAGSMDIGSLDASKLPTLPAAMAWMCLLVAASAKSGQLPFSSWLSRAMEGPTPSSTLFYAAVMIHAGPMLLLRAAPLLMHAPGVGAAAVAVGGLTAVYAWLVSLAQTDIKSAYVHAAMSQVGVSFVLVGLGLPRLALWHIVGHACLRGYQVMTSPSYRLQVRGQAIAPVPAWLASMQRLRAAAAARFWLEDLQRDQLIAPLARVARQLGAFDTAVVDRATAWPAPATGVLSALAAWEEEHLALDPVRRSTEPGLLARAVLGVARAAQRAEDLFVHHWMGVVLPRLIGQLGQALEAVELGLAEAWTVPAAVVLITALLVGGGR